MFDYNNDHTKETTVKITKFTSLSTWLTECEIAAVQCLSAGGSGSIPEAGKLYSGFHPSGVGK